MLLVVSAATVVGCSLNPRPEDPGFDDGDSLIGGSGSEREGPAFGNGGSSDDHGGGQGGQGPGLVPGSPDFGSDAGAAPPTFVGDGGRKEASDGGTGESRADARPPDGGLTDAGAADGPVWDAAGPDVRADAGPNNPDGG